MTGPDVDHYNPDTERALIGAALAHPDAAALTTTLPPTAFGDPRHQRIWAAITSRVLIGEPVDPTLIAHDLAHIRWPAGNTTGRTLLAAIGGATWLTDTYHNAPPSPANAHLYAAQILEAHRTREQRAIITRLDQTHTNITDPDRRNQLITEYATHLLATVTTPTHNGHRINLKEASMFNIRPVRWGWENRMPLGELVLIPGREGAGKSIFLAWLASAITNGNLPGAWQGQPRAVLYAASEDSWEYTIAPRMLAAGANLDLVYRVDTTTADGTTTGLNLPRDCEHLPDAARSVNAAILMCDPILSLVNENINSFRASELRTALEPLKHAAEQAGIVVAALVHFNKGRHDDINSMISGARAWAEVARAVLAIAVDRDADEYTVVVTQTKNNLGTLQLPNLAYTIDDVVLETSEGDAHIGRLRWFGETDTSAEDLLTGDPSDRTLSDNTLSIINFVDQHDDLEVPLQTILEHFKDIIKPATVRKTLSRCIKRGDLVSQTRGTYSIPKKGRTGRTTTGKRPR